MRGLWGALTVTLLLAAPAAAEWRGPAWVRGAQPAAIPVLAVNQGGDALLVWESRGRLQFAEARDGGRFGRAQKLRGTAAEYRVSNLQAALADDGSAAIAWAQCRRYDPRFGCALEGIRAAVRPPGRGFARSRFLSSADEAAFGPAITLREGRAVVAWWQFDGLWAARTRDDMRFSAGRRLVRSPRESLFEPAPALGFTASGLESYVFLERGVKAVVRRARGGVRRPRRLVSERAASVRAAWAETGERALLWTTSRHGHTLRAATFGPRGRSTPVTLDDRSGPKTDAVLAGAPDGRYVVAWIHDLRPGPFYDIGVWASIRVTGGEFSARRRVPAIEPVGSVAAAVSRSGHALLAWVGAHDRIETAVAAGSGRFRAGRSFRPGTADGTCGCAPSLGLDARGRGYLAWAEGPNLWYARYRP